MKWNENIINVAIDTCNLDAVSIALVKLNDPSKTLFWYQQHNNGNNNRVGALFPDWRHRHTPGLIKSNGLKR